MSRRRPGVRHHSRQAALQVLYAFDLADRAVSGPRPSDDETFDRVVQNFDLPAGAEDFARALVRGTVACRSELDAVLASHAEHWRIPRMATVDRNILRLACYELTRTDTPSSVILDEAIELARRVGSDASPGFVNGVLDAIARGARAPGPVQASR